LNKKISIQTFIYQLHTRAHNMDKILIKKIPVQKLAETSRQ